MIKAEATALPSSRPEAAFVLLLLQSLFWAIAGLSALPFVFGGEVYMLALGVVTLLFALGTCLVAIGVLWRRRWARRVAMVLEIACVAGGALLWVVPIGFNHGLVSLLVNLALPVAIVAVLRKPREAFPG